MNNPRFPHKLRIVKVKKDATGKIVTDYDGTPQYETENVQLVEMFDNEPVKDENGEFVTSETEYLEFGFRTANASFNTNGDVVTHSNKLSTPLFINPLVFGDVLEIVTYDRTYKVKVVDKKMFNFGANIFVTELGN